MSASAEATWLTGGHDSSGPRTCTAACRGYFALMTTQPTGDSPQKNPNEWTTGDEPATAAQLSYLETLARDSGADVPEQLTKSEASQLIDRLQSASPRLSDESAES
jgi:Protein of unknown function (DUF3072)